MANILALLSANHILQAFIVGAVFAFLTANLLMNAALKAVTTTVNGWSITTRCGQPGNGLLLRAACAKILPGVNSIEEAAYWTTTVDHAGRRLNGRRQYVLRFPAGQLPPNAAFWSLTITDVAGFMQSNAINRCSLGARSGLVPNADGSIEIYIQAAAPLRREPNWLPAPSGSFKLMLRAYMPGAAVLDGSYHLPPVNRAA
jgi:hypothetical protein